MTDYWKYVKPDPRGLEDNPYINPPKRGNGLEPSVVSNPKPEISATKILNLNDFLELEDISCKNSKGAVFEHYDQLFVRKDIERDSNNPDNKTNQVNFTPYNAIAHFESKGLFLPSFALSFNILAALYANKSDAEVAKVLNQYKDKGNGAGWHAQNTLINWGTKQVIHYPGKADYPSAGGTTDINTQRTRKPLSFDNAGILDSTLEDALRNPNYRKFMQDLTGFPNPEILVEIGAYFGKSVYSWISSGNQTRAVWLGCSNDYFGIDAIGSLDNNVAARGVRSK